MRYEFLIAFTRESKMLLDNLGIWIPQERLSWHDAHEAARTAWYGKGWLARLWCRHLRPRLRPRTHRRLYFEMEATKKMLDAEYLLAVWKMAEELGYTADHSPTGGGVS
jgi:hypothetical protein